MTGPTTILWRNSIFVILCAVALPTTAVAKLKLRVIGTYRTGMFDEGGAEIVAYHAATKRLFSVNGGKGTIEILDLSNPAQPKLVKQLAIKPHGKAATHVAIHGDMIAASVENDDKQQPGKVVLLDSGGKILSSVTVGPLPDMLTFTPDGKKILVANEGEPSDDYSVDPEGSVSIIDVSGGVETLTDDNVTTVGFKKFNDAELDPAVRVFGPGAKPSQDFEPEYIAVTPDSKTAYVVLQENNAIAEFDVAEGQVTKILGLGFKDHSQERYGFDGSDKDDKAEVRTWPTKGMYLPDAIGCFVIGGKPYLVTANEGDSRDYEGFSEEERLGKVKLDEKAFPNAAELQKKSNLGRLKISTAGADPDGDGDLDVIYSYGGRSLSIWTTNAERVYDTGDHLELITKHYLSSNFNSNNDENNSFDSRSDDKGPEPEGLELATIDGRTYVFLGLERIGGIAVYDLTEPKKPAFITYTNNRDFNGNAQAGTAGDLGPEGLHYISAADSPSGRPLLAVANEVSGSVTIYEVVK